MGSAVTGELVPAPGAKIAPPAAAGAPVDLSPAPGAKIAPPAAPPADDGQTIDPMSGATSTDAADFASGARKVGKFFGQLGATANSQAQALGNGLMMGTNVPISAALQHAFTGEPYEEARKRFQAADLSRKEGRDVVGKILEAAAPAVTASLVPGGILAQGAAAGTGSAVGEGLSRGDSAGDIAKNAAIQGTAGAVTGKLAEMGITAMTNAAAGKVAQEGLKKWASQLKSEIGGNLVINPSDEIAPGFTVGQAIENYTPLAAKGHKDAQAAIIDIAKRFGKPPTMTADDLISRVAGSAAAPRAVASLPSKVVNGAMVAGPAIMAGAGHLGMAAGTAGAMIAAKGSKEMASRALVALVRARAAGSVTADMVNQAIQLGVPRLAALGAAGIAGAVTGQ